MKQKSIARLKKNRGRPDSVKDGGKRGSTRGKGVFFKERKIEKGGKGRKTGAGTRKKRRL